jgi:hypothetical protein
MVLVGPMPIMMSRNGNNFLVTFPDSLSCAIPAIAIRYDSVEPFPSSSLLASCYFHHVCRYHGLRSAVLHAVHTNSGSVFTGKFWTALMALSGTSVWMSTAFHPNTQGLVAESANCPILSSLKRCLNCLYQTWDEQVGAVEFAYKTCTHSQASAGSTPFEAFHGFNPSGCSSLMHTPTLPCQCDMPPLSHCTMQKLS